jgi:hypothetical protein
MGIQGYTTWVWKDNYSGRARYAETMMDIIKQWIEPSTQITSDCCPPTVDIKRKDTHTQDTQEHLWINEQTCT